MGVAELALYGTYMFDSNEAPSGLMTTTSGWLPVVIVWQEVHLSCLSRAWHARALANCTAEVFPNPLGP
jgi:hypothetical protein